MPVSAFASLLLVLGVSLGIVGDALLNTYPWGLNLPIWCTLAAIALVGVQRATRAQLSLRFWASLSAWTAISWLFAWRDSTELRVFNLAALVLLTGILLLEIQPRLALPLNWGAALLQRIGQALWRGFGVLDTWANTRVPGSEETKAKRMALLRGGAIAAPLLLMFGTLMASADAAFESLVSQAFDWNLDVELGVSHLAGFIGATWVAIGLLSAPGAPHLVRRDEKKPLTSESDPPAPPLRAAAWKIGLTEVGLVLGSLVILFGAFVAIQFRYLFGGDGHVQAIAGLTYADYARKGFFELVWVTVLALPVILACRSIASREGPRGHRLFVSLGGTLVAMLFVVIASAWTRMGLYVHAYGLTALRFYVCASVVSIGTVLAWLMLTSFRNSPRAFAPGVAAIAVFTVLVLNFANPDRRIASFNLDRAIATGHLDGGYPGRLSADAAPAIFESLPLLKWNLRDEAERAFVRTADRVEKRDWRSWTWSEHLALESAGARNRLARR